jgi:hypothetical protein
MGALQDVREHEEGGRHPEDAGTTKFVEKYSPSGRLLEYGSYFDKLQKKTSVERSPVEWSTDRL